METTCNKINAPYNNGMWDLVLTPPCLHQSLDDGYLDVDKIEQSSLDLSYFHLIPQTWGGEMKGMLVVSLHGIQFWKSVIGI